MSSDKQIISLRTLQCIKRKQKVFSKYIAEVHAAHVLLDKQVLLQELNKLAQLLVSYKTDDVLIISSNTEHHSCYSAFGDLLQYRVHATHYKRGTFNNCLQEPFLEARVLFTCHDRRDRLAIIDAKRERAIIVGFTNFARGYKYYDFFVPANTFSKDAMIVSFYLLYKFIKTKKSEAYITFEEFKNLAQ